MERSYFSRGLPALLVLVQFTLLYMNTCCSAETYTQFIKTSCGATTYPDLCFTTLSSYATKIQASPKLLAITALSVSLKATRSASTLMTKLSKSHGFSPKEAAALRDCVEELSDSVDEIQKSIGEMEYAGGKNFELRMDDVKTWVSAALTDEDTCMDGFSGSVKPTVRTHILNVAHMTSNALALVNSYAANQKM